MSILNVNNQVTRIKGIVQNLKNSGIDIPHELAEEIKLSDRLRLAQDAKHMERVSAMNALSNATADEFEAALSNAETSWATNESADEFTYQVQAIQYGRIRNALNVASGDLMIKAADKINERS